MPIPNDNLRNALADTAIAINKGQDKIVSKLDELQTKKDEKVESYKDDKKTSQQAILSQIKDVETAIKDQKEVESISINNPEAITGDLKAGLQGIIEALKTELKNFDKNITVKNDFSNFASLFKSSQDKTSILKGLEKIETAVKSLDSNDIDYRLILSDIAEAVEDKEAVSVLKEILDKEFNFQFPEVMPVDLDPNLIEDGRVKTILPEEQVKKMSAILTQGGSNIKLVVDAINEQTETLSANTEQMSVNNELLEQVLLELKIINVHQQSMTDEEVNEADVEKR